jgi:hypothetical protein
MKVFLETRVCACFRKSRVCARSIGHHTSAIVRKPFVHEALRSFYAPR